MTDVRNCPCCGAQARCSRREFSEQAWAVLVIWGEVEESVVDQPVCSSCYEELRDILIDRAGEIEATLKDPQPYMAPTHLRPVATAKKAASKAAPKKKTSVKVAASTKSKSNSKPKTAAAKKRVKDTKGKKTRKVSRLAS